MNALPPGLTEDEVVIYARLRIRLVKKDQEKLDKLIDSLLGRLAEPKNPDKDAITIWR